mgnify:CR=1 FL=1
MRHDEYCRSHVGIAAAQIKEQRGVQTDAGGTRYVSLDDGSYHHVRVIQVDERGGEFHRRLAEAFSLPFHDLSAE